MIQELLKSYCWQPFKTAQCHHCHLCNQPPKMGLALSRFILVLNSPVALCCLAFRKACPAKSQLLGKQWGLNTPAAEVRALLPGM